MQLQASLLGCDPSCEVPAWAVWPGCVGLADVGELGVFLRVLVRQQQLALNLPPQAQKK